MPGTAPKTIRIIPLAAVSCALLAYAMSTRAVPNEWFKKPLVALQASKTLIMIPCPRGMRTFSGACPANDLQITLTSNADGFRNPDFTYTVGAGRILGERNYVVWDLSGVPPGIYTASVEVRDNKKRRAVSSVTVTVKECRDCVSDHTCFCPPLFVMCYDEVMAGTPITCKVAMPPQRECAVQYVWSVYGYSGEDLSGKLRSRDTYVSIPTETLAGQTITVEVEVKGLDPSCSSTASSQTKVKP
jgi:hypothetical protein